ncbi:FecCD family ABC transporter permease [Vibrio nigripulchritudo]|uniref:FecCD family ABC transporter permease n=1 Tax=Vibrio nigripulchritudo TaxID=28173 RepID=UPI002491EE9D|nr:iron ABC transporter permease [Vibrio nigripulchritudo]BDU36318.1 siderophore ABC transporter permease [Vibrio nigripulchritudo]BDU41975.1 siderophore ABC transporter permease [Vibrio nigripulchritudo]
MKLRFFSYAIVLTIFFVTLMLNLSFGAKSVEWLEILKSYFAFNDQSYDHFIIRHQREPRALIAIFVGATMAISGAVLQGLTRNPLASPSLLGISSGASLFVVFFGFYFVVPLEFHGYIALGGGFFGFISVVLLSKIAGIKNDPRNLSLILAGAIVSMLYGAIANSLILADQNLRNSLMNWLSGNINHVYFERLTEFWWLGLLAFILLWSQSHALTLMTLGVEKAESAGVSVKRTQLIAILCCVTASSAAVAICGPIGFIGLVVPHIVRPFAGAHFAHQLPMNAFVGATIGLLADMVARLGFAPFVLNTSVVMELLGGIVFIFIVRHFYLSNGAKTA